MPKIKNIIIFVIIAAIFVSVYVYFIKGSPDDAPTLVSSSENTVLPVSPSAGTSATGSNPLITQDFLNLLLNVKTIKLNDAIFSDDAFIGLRDSSIILTPDGNEGRVNPFAPLGRDTVVAPLPPTCTLPQVLNTATNICVTPLVCAAPKVFNISTNTCVNPPSN